MYIVKLKALQDNKKDSNIEKQDSLADPTLYMHYIYSGFLYMTFETRQGNLQR